jgi:hypothetical protein
MLPELDTEAFSPPPPPPPPVGEAWSVLGADAPSPSLPPQLPAHSVTSSASARAREPKHVHLVLSPRLSSQLTRPVSNGAGPDRSCKAAAPAEADRKRAAARAEPMHTGRHGRAAASELSEEEPKRRRMVCRRLAALPPRPHGYTRTARHSRTASPASLASFEPAGPARTLTHSPPQRRVAARRRTKQRFALLCDRMPTGGLPPRSIPRCCCCCTS